MKINKTTETIEKVTIKLTACDIREFLVANGTIPPDQYCEIYVPVPGGGDWSNTNLDIENDSSVYVAYEKVFRS